MKYDSNTAEIEALIEKVRNLTPDQAESLSAARNNIRSNVWANAWDAALDAFSDWAPRDVQNSVLIAVWSVPVWGALQDTIRDTATALAIRDRIPAEYFDVLYKPWKDVMES